MRATRCFFRQSLVAEINWPWTNARAERRSQWLFPFIAFVSFFDPVKSDSTFFFFCFQSEIFFWQSVGFFFLHVAVMKGNFRRFLFFLLFGSVETDKFNVNSWKSFYALDYVVCDFVEYLLLRSQSDPQRIDRWTFWWMSKNKRMKRWFLNYIMLI